MVLLCLALLALCLVRLLHMLILHETKGEGRDLQLDRGWLLSIRERDPDKDQYMS